jgi:triphosphoribosyl-dephospho-CoA synthetase
MAWNHFWRTAAGRLAFSLSQAPADCYQSMCHAVATEFKLSPRPGLVTNTFDIVFRDYSRDRFVVSLEWDNWLGFTVVAQTPEAEPLIQEIGAWLLESKWATKVAGSEVLP